MIELSDEQRKIINDIYDWYKFAYPNYIKVGGYAGTGKTTLIPHIIDKIRKEQKRPFLFNVAYVSFTGKAASVLRTKLNQNNFLQQTDFVGTIHKLLYTPRTTINEQGKRIIVGWVRNQSLDYNLIVIDEASMVSQSLWNDLNSYNIPIIAVGDHGQLPPVGETYGLMNNPDLRLNQIQRQALNNPIINLSKIVRHNGVIPVGMYSNTVFKFDWSMQQCKDIFNSIQFDNETICLCGFNQTRVNLNKRIRESLNYKMDTPYPGERVICLKNNHDTKVMNGQLGTVVWLLPSQDPDIYDMTIQIDGEEDSYSALVYNKCFGQVSYETAHEENLIKKYVKSLIKRKDVSGIDVYDFGYAITVHRSQGSEWNRVILFDQRISKWDDDMYRRWLYTGVTRAKDKLFIISNFW